MKKRSLYFLPVLAALILEILPFGAVCNFALDGGETLRKTYSYFDLVPFGYANFAPLLTALTTLVTLGLLIAYLFSGRAYWIKVAKIATVCGLLLSLCPLLFGISYFSFVGVFISFSLLLQAVLLYVSERKMVAIKD